MNVRRFIGVIIAVGAIGGLVASCAAAADRETVMQKIKAGALVVDVRTPAEFAAGHVDCAINIPLNELESRIAEFGDKNKPVVVYCRTGNRSGKARSILMNHGYRDVINGGGLRDMPRGC